MISALGGNCRFHACAIFILLDWINPLVNGKDKQMKQLSINYNIHGRKLALNGFICTVSVPECDTLNEA